MFINSSAFKKLIKEAYRCGRLIVGAAEKEYFIEGGSWIIRIHKKAFPKKEKAAVIELTGELPAAGEVFRAAKGAANQYEIPENSTWDIRENARKCKEILSVTKALYQTGDHTCRILQHKRTQKCIPVNEQFISALSHDAMQNDEAIPIGPVVMDPDAEILYWFNETMAFAVCKISAGGETEFEEYLQLLENVELDEKNIF